MIRNKIVSAVFSILIFFVFGSASLFAFGVTSSFVVINEFQVDNPGGDLTTCEYIELRGDPNTFVSNSPLYILEVEGDGGGAGTVDFARDISGFTFGTNGILVISGPVGLPQIKGANTGLPGGAPCGPRNYVADGATLVNELITLENGSISFMLVSTEKSVISIGDDIDTDNNGTIDNLPGDATIIDAAGWTDGGALDFAYGGVNITPATGTPDAATRNFSNITPLDPTAWFADIIVGGLAAVLYSQTNLIGGYRIDFITPGEQNLAPSAADGTISGRARSANGRGVKHAVVMLMGGDLPEAIYATTNQFGHYKFEDVQVGQSYVLQITSRRYIFQNPSRIVNLEDSITNADFIVEDSSQK